jgi:uncharacterized protein (TIGR03083 family)
MDWTRIGPPADVRPLLPRERAALLDLLGPLTPEQWARPTVCLGWTVHHVTGHIVHGYLRKLSGLRDGHRGGYFAGPREELPAFLAQINGQFADLAVTLSPAVLIDLVAHYGPQLDAMWAAADLTAAGSDVSWIVPGVPAPAWVDLGRELSELWIHQQQVRDAAGVAGGRDPELLRAVLDTLVRSLPRALAEVTAAPGATVTVEVTGDLSAAWPVVRDQDGWRLVPAADRGGAELARVRMPADLLWRVASRGVAPDEAAAAAELTGDQSAGRAALGLLSIIR